MEELVDFVGLPEHDAVLQYADERHGGNTEQPHTRALMRVERDQWADRAVRKQIVAQMWAQEKGFVPEYYAVRDTMREDAAKCFAKHHRAVPCLDYQDASKRIGNPAAADRAALSKATKRDLRGGGPKVYICNFCVVQTFVDRAKLDANSTHQF